MSLSLLKRHTYSRLSRSVLDILWRQFWSFRLFLRTTNLWLFNNLCWNRRIFGHHLNTKKLTKPSCDTRFQRAFTTCVCVFKVFTLFWANQGKTQQRAVNARRNRVWQRAFIDAFLCTMLLAAEIERGINSSFIWFPYSGNW